MRGRVEICGINTAAGAGTEARGKHGAAAPGEAGGRAGPAAADCGNLRLVLAAVKRFAGRGENVDDLFQVGCIGLMKSIDAFDLSYDVRLSSYSLPMIIGEIRRYLRDNSPLRVSRSVRDTAYRVLQAREKLLARQQREPTVEQIARELGIRREEVVFAMDAMADPVSLYEPLYDSGGDALRIMDQIGDENSTDSCWLQQLALKDAIARLTPVSGIFWPCATARGRPRWRFPGR